MAGGASTPALAAAVTEAAGLGYVAAGYKTAAAVADDLAAVRAATSGPLALNVFIVERHMPLEGELDPDTGLIAPARIRYALTPAGQTEEALPRPALGTPTEGDA